MTQKSLVDGGNYSSVHVSLGNGYGSTYRRRYTTVNVNVGSAITYADSASGSSFTINVAGIYSCTMCENYPNQGQFGIHRNEVNQPVSITAPNRLAASHTIPGIGVQAARESSCSWTGPLEVGDIIYPSGDGTTPTNSASSIFTITKIA
jgi:hypothetical protein